jgi:hypothetical protein
MKLQRVMLALTAMMFLFAGKSSAQQWRPTTIAAQTLPNKTYSWEQVKTKDPLDVDRIKNDVNAALAAKGWTQVDSGGDVSIAFGGLRPFTRVLW